MWEIGNDCETRMRHARKARQHCDLQAEGHDLLDEPLQLAERAPGHIKCISIADCQPVLCIVVAPAQEPRSAEHTVAIHCTGCRGVFSHCDVQVELVVLVLS